MNPEIFSKRYDLEKQKLLLANMILIPDMLWYAAAWLQLAGEYQAIEMLCNESYCRSRGEHYGKIAQGAYIKRVDGCLAELVEVKPAQPAHVVGRGVVEA